MFCSARAVGGWGGLYRRQTMFEFKEGRGMIQIDHDIPVPDSKYRTKYPWNQMKVGDSFCAQLTENQRKGLHSCAKRAGIKITTRTTEEGIRVWRIN